MYQSIISGRTAGRLMKEWTSPELTILKRQNAGEEVLSACKTSGLGAGADLGDDYCYMLTGYSCQTLLSS